MKKDAGSTLGVGAAATGALGVAEREASLATLANGEVDLVVVGGGIIGAGCALDAAQRGLSVALLEQSDLAAGTSSRSSKLIHGGLRYLEQWRFGLVREALRERTLIESKLAPHLVHPVPFLFLFGSSGSRASAVWRRCYVGVGVALYDLLARLRMLDWRGRSGWRGAALPHHRHLGVEATQRLAPALDPTTHSGAVMYWDAQTDDARYTLAVARTASAFGAHVLTSVRVIGMRRDTTMLVSAVDRETGRELQIRAKAVINAAGVWSDDVDALSKAGEAGNAHTATSNQTADPTVRISKGVHLVVARDRIAASSGMVFTTDTSVLFVIPWPPLPDVAHSNKQSSTHWIIGTTDTDWHLDRTHPAATRSDIDYLLGEVNKVLADPLGDDDICGVYAGLRPLLAGEDSDTSKLSRKHSVDEPTPGLISVKGGKYTTYRVMAADAVHAAVCSAGLDVPPSATAGIPLVGAPDFDVAQGWDAAAAAVGLVEEFGISDRVTAHLLGRHGTQTAAVLNLAAADSSLLEPLAADSSLLEPLAADCGYLRVEVVYAVRAEAALHLDDVLTRRTRLSVETNDRAVNVAADAAALMATELGWTPDQQRDEVRYYVERVAAERYSQTRGTDQTAAAARRLATDARQHRP